MLPRRSSCRSERLTLGRFGRANPDLSRERSARDAAQCRDHCLKAVAFLSRHIAGRLVFHLEAGQARRHVVVDFKDLVQAGNQEHAPDVGGDGAELQFALMIDHL